jgi:hypothetical protein
VPISSVFHGIFYTPDWVVHAGVKDAEDKLTDTGYKRDVFTTCTNLCKEKKWSQLVPFMQNKTMRFEVVDEDGWKARLKKLLEESC